MKNIINKKLTLIFVTLTILVFLSSCEKEGINVSKEGTALENFTFEPENYALLGSSFVAIELGQSYVDSGAYAVDTTNGLLDENGNIVDSIFIGSPKILPDMSTEGIKTAVYTFRNADHSEFSLFRNIIVYKKQTGSPTNDISGSYKRGSVVTDVVKVTDGVYYIKNVLGTSSSYRRNIPALFYHTSDTLFHIIPQFYQQITSSYLVDYVDAALTDRNLYFEGTSEKVSYNTSAPNVILTYKLVPTAPDVVGPALLGLNSSSSGSIKLTTFIFNKQ